MKHEQNYFYDQREFMDETISFRMPVNKRGYIEDELLTLSQLKNEYGSICILDIRKEIRTGRLQVLRASEGILISRSEANRWHNDYLNNFRAYIDNTSKSNKLLSGNCQ